MRIPTPSFFIITKQEKVEQGAQDLGILEKCQIIPVESDYYDWELQQRA